MEKTPTPDPSGPEQWQKIKNLYHAALALDPASREAFLNSVGGTDEALRREVESLLRAHDNRQPLPPIEDILMGIYDDDVPLFETGSVLGNYRIVEQIGKGGSGAVYSAVDTRLEGSLPSRWSRKVALKVLHRQYAALFRREVQASGVLQHPHIAALYDIQLQDDICYAVMELVEGHTLKDRLRAGPLPADETLRLAIQLADAMDHVHNREIVHRDLKPGNIMLTAAGVKLLDFGIARLLNSASDTTLAHPGDIIGTGSYMSPEQIRGEAVDARSDIFSFGVIIYEMLSGKSPFRRDTRGLTFSAVLEQKPPSLEAMVPNILPALAQIVERCLEKHRDARLPSMREVKTALEAVRDTGRFMPNPANRHELRSEGGPLSPDEAKLMVIRHDFYEKDWNLSGKGIEHRYRRQILEGAIVIADDGTGLMWQRDSSSGRFQWGSDAAKYIVGLNAKKSAGFDNWRVPSLEELMSLVTPPEKGIPINLMSATETWDPENGSRWEEVERKTMVHLDPLFGKGDAHWTSNAASPMEAVGNWLDRGWAVSFIDGFCFQELTDRNYYIKAVRSM